MAKYRKKPVVIEAFQWHAEDMDVMPQWLSEAIENGTVDDAFMSAMAPTPWAAIQIKTLEGVMQANDGDWVIRGVQGELYPCKPGIFADTYEPAGEESPTAAIL